jgi:hypothetical protein
MKRNVRRVLIAVSLVTLLPYLILFTRGARPVDHPVSSTCTWVEDSSRPLNLENRADRGHLRDDAVIAEDVAIRWADTHFHLLPEWSARQNECMEALFDGVAKQHGVDVTVVRQYSVKRDVVLDSSVVLSLGALYAVVAFIFAGRIRSRFPTGEPGYWVMAPTMAIGICLAGVMIGILWSIVIDEVRLGSGHLSYRMDRILFRQHWAMLFVCGVAIFLVISLVRARLKADDYDPGQSYLISLR